jgi:hypothetical protein
VHDRPQWADGLGGVQCLIEAAGVRHVGGCKPGQRAEFLGDLGAARCGQVNNDHGHGPSDKCFYGPQSQT